MTHDEIYEERVARDKRNYPVMTHDKLLSLIDNEFTNCSPDCDSCDLSNKPWLALREIVQLHKPGGYEYFEKDICEHCTLDLDYYIFYPCPTIEAIQGNIQ